MDKEFIDTIQKKILELLPEDKRLEKTIFLADSCSELSRLVAFWISEKDSSTQNLILKGNKVCDTDKSHDVLVSIQDNRFYLIDPTIWQFFPNAESILVGEYSSSSEAISAAEAKYGGEWVQSEELINITLKDSDKWLKIIKENIAK